MKKKFRYQDFVNELRAGNQDGVFIDDTGSPGLQTRTEDLHPDRKSWVGVIVPRSQMKEVWKELPSALDELERLTGAKEFHFADIYAGRKQFGTITYNRRLAIFRFMAHIFSQYRFPSFVQTLDPNSIKKIKDQVTWPTSVGPFDTEKPEDLALLLLLLRIRTYLRMRGIDSFGLARVFVDEGYMKNGVAIGIPFWANAFADGLICFAKSDVIYPLQLADCAAFCLNRSQLLLQKSDLSARDHEFLRVIEPVVTKFQNIPVIRLD